MSTRDLLLEGLEQAINGLVALDPVAHSALAKLHGKRIELGLKGFGISLFFVPGANGHVQILGSVEGQPDASLVGSPLDLLRSRDPIDGAAQLFGGRVTITGDSGLAHQFGAILGGLDIDWEEQLSRLSGDLIAHKAGQFVRESKSYASQQAAQFEQNLSEYLVEEARLLPHPEEVAEFVQQVDQVREHFDRLQARLEQLERKA